MIDKKTFWIGVLSIIASVLLAAHVMSPSAPALLPAAMADESVLDRDYQMVTAALQRGGDALYVLDRTSNQVAVVVWNLQTRRPEVVDIRPVGAAFGR